MAQFAMMFGPALINESVSKAGRLATGDFEWSELFFDHKALGRVLGSPTTSTSTSSVGLELTSLLSGSSDISSVLSDPQKIGDISQSLNNLLKGGS
jgi:hypothetical protein